MASEIVFGFWRIAIVLMHRYCFKEHETALAKVAGEIGFTQIPVSHRVAPLIKLTGAATRLLVLAKAAHCAIDCGTAAQAARSGDGQPLLRFVAM